MTFGLPTISKLTFIFIYLTSIISYTFIIYKKPKRSFIVISLSLIILAISIFINEDIIRIIRTNDTDTFFTSPLMLFYLLNLPLFLLVFAVKNFDYLYKLLINYALINLIIVFAVLISQQIINVNITNYMTLAYNSITSIAIVFTYGIKYKKKRLLVLSLANSLFVLLGGSRGAALTLLVFYTLYYLISVNMSLKRVIVLIVFAFIVLCIVNNLEVIAIYLDGFFQNHGLSSRLIDMVVRDREGGLSHFNDRNVIIIPLIDALKIYGYGVFGDRTLVGIYAHNIVIELFVQYGIFFGSLIVLSILINILRMHKVAKNGTTKIKCFFAIMVSLFCAKYMFSQSYLNAPDLWLMLGIMLKVNDKKAIFDNDGKSFSGEIMANSGVVT